MLCSFRLIVEHVIVHRSICSPMPAGFVDCFECFEALERSLGWLLLESHTLVEVVAIYLKMRYFGDLVDFFSGYWYYHFHICYFYQMILGLKWIYCYLVLVNWFVNGSWLQIFLRFLVATQLFYCQRLIFNLVTWLEFRRLFRYQEGSVPRNCNLDLLGLEGCSLDYCWEYFQMDTDLAHINHTQVFMYQLCPKHFKNWLYWVLIICLHKINVYSLDSVFWTF